jgi:sialate O-acetylesterase
MNDKPFSMRAIVLALMLSIGLVPAGCVIGATAGKSGKKSLQLSSMFSNNMVLQRSMRDMIWGWANAGDTITVKFSGQKAVTHAAINGRWAVRIGPLAASSVPRTLFITDGAQHKTFRNVLVGEVWVCSGQSNMQYPMAGWFHRTNLSEALDQANHPGIRLYHVPMIDSMFAGRPHRLAPAHWRICTPHSAAGFSAVGYFFGNALRQHLRVPIGLIESDWGGTSIEAWTPAVGFFKYSHLKPEQRWLRHAMAREQLLHGRPAPLHRDGLVNAPNSYHYDFQSTWRPDPHQNPTTLFNGMIAPLIPYGIRGVIWYQGENNVLSHDTHYYQQLKALILGWRYLWHEGNFPFYIVQIAPFNYGQKWCGPDDNDAPFEPLIWQAEEKAARDLPDTGIVGTMDIGPGKAILDSNVNNIHPRDKEDVGMRLAWLALAKTYKLKHVAYSGPMFQSAQFSGSHVIIYFRHASGGLICRNGKSPDWFTIAGSNGKFFPAKAQIAGRTVVVSAKQILHPDAVRFAWSCIAQPNLANQAGLPAMPFQVARDRVAGH